MTPPPRLTVAFFRSHTGREPVRDWLRKLPSDERRMIGEEIKTVQIGWPLGMPLVRKIEKDLWEIRVTLPTRIARLLFTVHGRTMVLLHGFVKKSRALPSNEKSTAVKRMIQVQREGQ